MQASSRVALRLSTHAALVVIRSNTAFDSSFANLIRAQSPISANIHVDEQRFQLGAVWKEVGPQCIAVVAHRLHARHMDRVYVWCCWRMGHGPQRHARRSRTRPAGPRALAAGCREDSSLFLDRGLDRVTSTGPWVHLSACHCIGAPSKQTTQAREGLLALAAFLVFVCIAYSQLGLAAWREYEEAVRDASYAVRLARFLSDAW